MDEKLKKAENKLKNGFGTINKHPNTFQFEHWVYNARTHILSSENTSIPLTRTQASLLELFCLHSGEIISKDRLVEDVWDNKIITDNAISAALVQLRKTLGDDPKQPRYIETILNIGYRFLPDVIYGFDEKDEKKGLLTKTSYKLTAVVVVSILFFFGFTLYLPERNTGIQVSASYPKPITSAKGQELYGSYHAKTDLIVFSHQQLKDDLFTLSLIAKPMGEERYINLTDSAETQSSDFHAEISPSGNRIVFNRTNFTDQCDYMLADFDASELRLSNIQSIMPCPKGDGGLQISWKDEESLYLGYSLKLGEPQAIYRLNIKSRELFALTDVEHIEGQGDYSFAYSKLANKIAYLRNIDDINGIELWVLDLTNNSHKKLTTVKVVPFSVAWVNKGKYLVVRTALSELSIVDMNGVVSVIEGKTESSMSDPFSMSETKIGLMMKELYLSDVYIRDLNTHTTDNSLSSSTLDIRPAMAKLSEARAFVSKRDGLFQVWLSNKTGLSQLTHLQSLVAIQSLALSPDGHFLAYDADWGVVLLDETGKQLFVNSESSSNPTFSLDGQYLYFQTKNEKISRLSLKTMKLTPFLIRGIAPKAGDNGVLYFIKDRRLFKASATGGFSELGPLPEFSKISKPEHYDVIDGQLYYVKKIDGGLKLVKRPLSGGEDVVVTELSDRNFSLNNDASLMFSNRLTNGETQLEAIELIFP